jgi:hypothetical protein
MNFITRLSRIAVIILLAPLSLSAQQGGVTVTGQVSAVVAVSASPDARVLKGEAQVSAANLGVHTLSITLSGLSGGETQVEIPVRLRSNVDFTLAASCATSGASLSALSVVEVGAGAFVYPGAAARVEVPAAFDGRVGVAERRRARLDLSSPATFLSGPPVSMRGTLSSPGNMLEVVLRVAFRTPPGERGRHAELTLSATRRGQ